MAKQKTYHPLPFYFYISILWLVSRLPFRAQMQLGTMIGWLSYYLIKKRRQTTYRNIEACFPELDRAAQRQLVKKSYYSMGKSLLETATGLMSPVERWLPRFTIAHREILDDAIATGRPVIILSGHFGSLDLFGCFLQSLTPFAVIQRAHDNPRLDKLISQSRARFGRQPIDRKAMREMIKVLRKEQMPLWIGPDQDLGRQASVFAPFFGVETATVTSFAKLAQLSKAIVVPMSCHRTANGYIGRACSPIEFGDDERHNAALYNQWLEQEIRRAPEQYLWQHRRFKTRPDPTENFYR
ncbi:lysophospholipid acyltransferase family protein [Salinibius halmophilus]|uniref:lysophospholipid acyltransferase family protein n=1 Tax=Salinibius halmophilus TaxID=1853216 RepID=UPI000E674C96|nr:hypothetical protein [Salinibius halmophilus]